MSQSNPCHLFPLELPPPRLKREGGAWANVLDHVILPERRSAPWNNYYDDLSRLLLYKIRGERTFSRLPASERIKSGALRVVEIGTMYGGASERMLQTLPSIELFMIDPFLGGFAGETKEASVNGGTTLTNSTSLSMLRGWGLDVASLSRAWAQGMAYDFRSRFNCRVHVFHNFSLNVAPVVDDGSVDVAFIDGLHTFDALTADLHAWWPKVAADGGVIILNDYGSARHPDVHRAAKAFFRNNATICVGSKHNPPGHRNAWVVKGIPEGCSWHGR